MEMLQHVLTWLLLVPVAGGCVWWVLCLAATIVFRASGPPSAPDPPAGWPPVTILKPVCGLEKNLRANLRSACLQDYPEFQVVLSVQGADDPAVPLLRELRAEFPDRVSVAIGNRRVGANGKVNNLAGALPHALHEILVISDSDVRLDSGYLKSIAAPLLDPDVAFACTLYRAVSAERWFEKMELLTLNADFIPAVVFAYVTGTASFCLGSSVAFRRSSLEEIGGFEALADYLVEDYEMGRRLRLGGGRMVLVPHVVDITVDLENAARWWDHQVGWDRKTYAANPAGFLAAVVTRSLPFALLFAVLHAGDAVGPAVLGGVLALRLATAAAAALWGLGDREGLRSMALLPLRDVASLATWGLAVTGRAITWRGQKMTVDRKGRLSLWKSPN